MPTKSYITTSIPYVNAPPHIGHALEFVEADVLARARRRQGTQVRLQSGTDDHALKNVRAAEAAGVPVRDHVDANAARFLDLLSALDVSPDDVIRTSLDPRHRPGVERLWQACFDAGDLYQRDYSGLYCVGCEEFFEDDELDDGGLCPDHKVAPEWVRERNWFFRLTRYEARVRDLLASGAYRIEPESARREVLSFVERGLHDFSVSRTAERARGWGIAVPGDPGQVVSVWYDALGNYLTALGYRGAPGIEWWTDSDERVHVVGKDIVRFHAVYWPAILLSAGLPLPSALFVHGFLTIDGAKIGKSLGNAVDPLALVERFGADALRWWLASELPLGADADFTIERLVDRANLDLANGIGNLVGRLTTLAARLGGTPAALVDTSAPVYQAAAALPSTIAAHLERFDLRRATQALTAAVGAVNRELESERPWEGPADARVEAVVATSVAATRRIVEWFQPFVPRLAARALARLDGTTDSAPLFPRLHAGSG